MRGKHYFLIAMLLILAVLTGIFSYWNLEGVLFHRVFDTNEIILITTKNIYSQGETVQATFTTCKNLNVNAKIQWSIIDTYIRSYPPRQGKNSFIGCVENQLATLEILSDTLPNDTYYFSGTATYRLNPIKTIVVPLKTNSFEVK